MINDKINYTEKHHSEISEQQGFTKKDAKTSTEGGKNVTYKHQGIK